MVVYYSQSVNHLSLLNAYFLLKIDKLADNVAQYRFFNTNDLKFTYHQVFISEDKFYPAFEICDQLYQFCWILFGVTNGVVYFQHLIEVIVDNLFSDMFTYLDNITLLER